MPFNAPTMCIYDLQWHIVIKQATCGTLLTDLSPDPSTFEPAYFSTMGATCMGQAKQINKTKSHFNNIIIVKGEWWVGEKEVANLNIYLNTHIHYIIQIHNSVTWD